MKPLRLIPILFVFVHLWVGLLMVDDYGVPVDEWGNLHKGRVTLHYIKARFGVFDEAATAHALADWEKLQAKYYGTFFEMLLTEFTDLLRIEDVGEMFRIRHRIVFGLFWFAGLCVYGTLRCAKLPIPWALLGWTAFVLHPRIFSQSFYNHKDVAFLSMCAIGIFFLTRWLLQGDRLSALAFIGVAAVASATRVMGIELLVLGLAWWGLRQLLESGWVGLARRLWVPLLALGGFALCLFVCWPYLWDAPLERFSKGFGVMAKYTTYGGDCLFAGERIPSTDLPWFYLPVWIAITTPLPMLIGLCAGMLLVAGSFARRFAESLRSDAMQLAAVGAAFFFGTIFAVILKQSVLYDGWRQVYFIWPGALLAGTIGLASLATCDRWCKSPWLPVVLLALFSFPSVQVLWRAHPHGMVYFNALAGNDLEADWELDYWGLGYRDGLEALASLQPEGEIRVYDTFWRALYLRGNVTRLPMADRERIVSVRSLEDADYLITNYRPGESIKSYGRGRAPLHHPVYELEVAGAPVVGVYARNRAEGGVE